MSSCVDFLSEDHTNVGGHDGRIDINQFGLGRGAELNCH
jgi:hypothetical protein